MATFIADVVLLVDALVPLDNAAVLSALAAAPATAVVLFLATAFGVEAAASGRCVVAFFLSAVAVDVGIDIFAKLFYSLWRARQTMRKYSFALSCGEILLNYYYPVFVPCYWLFAWLRCLSFDVFLVVVLSLLASSDVVE